MNQNESVITYQEKLLSVVQGASDFGTRPDDQAAAVALIEAIKALKENNYAIGACLVDNHTNDFILTGRNRVFYPYFRSDRHAEMDVLTKLEKIIKGSRTDLSSTTLVTSLEPCPMCLGRCISSGIGTVKYVSPDEEGGMVQFMNAMPNAFKMISENQNQVYKEADCHPKLKDMALNIFLDTKDALDEKLGKISSKPFKIPTSSKDYSLVQAITNLSR